MPARGQVAIGIELPGLLELRPAQRRTLDGARVALGVDERGDGARFRDEHQHRAAEQHDRHGREEAGERGRPAGERAEHGRHHVAHVAAEQIVEVVTDDEDHEQDAAGDRHAQQQLEERFRDELDQHHRPVGGGHQCSAFEDGLETRRVSHVCATSTTATSQYSRIGAVVSCATVVSCVCPAHCAADVGAESRDADVTSGGHVICCHGEVRAPTCSSMLIR